MKKLELATENKAMAATKVGDRQLTDFYTAPGEFTGDGTTVNTAFSIGIVPVSKGGTGATANTGTGSNVLSTSPALVTPNIGVATASSLNITGLTASQAVLTDGSKNLVSVGATGSGNVVRATSPTLVTPALGAATATTPTAKDSSTKVATTAFVGKQFTITANGTGSATTISIAHGVSGVTTASSVIAIANNAASAGISYVTVDATNVNIFYATAPVSGTANLLYTISIK